jgi:hypothetical protein
MNRRKLTQLTTVLIIASFIIIGATQRFDKIIAKSLITTSSSGITLNGSGTLDLGSGDMTIASGDLALTAGNLAVGDGTPTFTQDGEDAYIEGLVEFGSDFVSGAQSTFTVDFAFPITPTGLYQPLDSADLGNGDGAAPTDIAAPTDDTIGKQLILHNINASQVITIDGTGATVECKSDIIMGAGDTLILLWNGDDWNCLASYDNS